MQIDSVSGEYRYNAAFLETGDYTIAHTCQTALDDPAMDYALVFSGNATVTVNVNIITLHNLLRDREQVNSVQSD